MNMFAIGSNAPVAVESLLNYGSRIRRSGLCAYASLYAPVDHDSHRIALRRLISADTERVATGYAYPVEYALLASGSSNSAEDICDEAELAYCTLDNKADERTASGQLRIWWAYNLAVVLSNMK